MKAMASERTGLLIKSKIKKNGFKKNHYNLNLTVMALPGILFFFIFSYLPIIGIVVAFKEFNVVDGILFSPWIGFKNFEFFLKSQILNRIIFNTLFLNFLFIITGTIFQVGIAILFNEIKCKMFVKVTNSIMFLPYFISWVIAGYFTYALLNMDYGLVNTTLTSLGIQPVEWYNSPGYWPGILTLANLWKVVGYGSIIYTASIAGINNEYYEASMLDGASRWQQIKNITIPLIRPQITILTLLALGRIFYADFGMFYNLTQGAGTLFKTTDVMDTYVYRALRITGDIGMSSAAGLFQSVIGFVLVLVSNAVVRKYDSENALF